MLVRTENGIVAIKGYSVMGEGLQRKFSSSATLPQVEQKNCMATSLSRQTCRAPASGVPQKLQEDVVSHGLHRCPGVSAAAPQVVHI